MRKLTLALVVILLLLAAFPVSAAEPANFGGEGEAWEDDGGNHYTNKKNEDVRFDWDNLFVAVPGCGGANADESAIATEHGDQTLVRAGEASMK